MLVSQVSASMSNKFNEMFVYSLIELNMLHVVGPKHKPTFETTHSHEDVNRCDFHKKLASSLLKAMGSFGLARGLGLVRTMRKLWQAGIGVG